MAFSHQDLGFRSTASVPAAPAAPSRAGNLALLCVTGPLDDAGALRLRERVRSLSLNSRCLILDLGAVEFIDSDGVRALLLMAEELDGESRELRLVIRPGSRVERTLGLLRLLERFRVFPTLPEARSYAGLA
jgi:anti-anti-sigma factor